MSEEVQVIVPAQDHDAVSSYMTLLSRELAKLDPDSQHHGFLGGEDGYGCEFVNDVFEMHPYYWGDCTCGFDEKWEAAETAWSAANKHKPDCYQAELKAREAAYDEGSGYNRIDAAAKVPMNVETTEQEVMPGLVGTMTRSWRTPEGERAHAAWCTAYDRRNEFRDALADEMCKKYGLGKQGWGCHCTCGHQEKWQAFYPTIGDHQPRCPSVLPNFRHTASGVTVNWYKYIGRDMEVQAPHGFDWWTCIQECIASAALSPTPRAQQEET